MLQQYLGKFWGLNEAGVLKNKETAKTQKKKNSYNDFSYRKL